ncbi:MAG: hypothetical protein LC635_02180 [Pseudonocardiaceae bacterium]|nr:hypothetical protein [Pseudonocardiaceae bacterium]
MIEILATVLTYVALAAAVWAAVLVVASQPLRIREWHGLWLLGLVALLELGLFAQLVGGVVRMIGDDRELDAFAFVGYLVAPLVVLPLAALWSLAERTRWGAGVLVIGCLTVPVLIVRLRQVWEAHG